MKQLPAKIRIKEEEVMSSGDFTELEALRFKELSRRGFLRGMVSVDAAALALPAVSLI